MNQNENMSVEITLTEENESSTAMYDLSPEDFAALTATATELELQLGPTIEADTCVHCPDRAEHWFQLLVIKNAKYSFSADVCVGARLYDVYGNLLASDNDDGEKNSFLIDYELDEWTAYYLRVMPKRNHFMRFNTVIANTAISVESISVSPNAVTLMPGEKITLSASVVPQNATWWRLIWSSSDNNVARVDYSNGVVTAVSPGMATISARTLGGSDVYGGCLVTCNTPDTDSTPEHSDTSSHIYQVAISEDGEEYTFTCTSSQCNDSFTVPKDQVVGSYVTSDTDQRLGNSQTPLAYGIDVSNHQGEISQSQWDEIAKTQINGQRITFAILRIGREVANNEDGSFNRKMDEQFVNNYERAKKAKLKLGCYYFTESWSPQNAVADAEQVIEWIGNKQFEYPVFFDIESDDISNNQNVPNDTVRTEICTAFMNKMREEGFFTALYTNAEWITDYLNSSTLFPKYDFWYARYREGHSTPDFWGWNQETTKYKWPEGGKKFGMWQYAEKQPISPISEEVDYDVAYKNYPLIIKSLHLNNF